MRIDFFLIGCGFSLVVNELEQKSSRPFSEDDRDLIAIVLQKVEKNHPELYIMLLDKYDKITSGRFKIIRRFLKCNFSENDHQPDIDNDLNFCLEIVHCLICGKCPDENILCNTTINTIPTNRELEYPLLIFGLTDDEIGKELFVSPNIVKNTRNKIFLKPAFKTPKALTLLTNHAYEN